MNIVHWLSLLFIGCSFLCPIFFGSFVLVLPVNSMFEFVIYIDMVERVSSLLNYYVYIRHACTACMSLQKTDLCLYIYINSCYNIFMVIQ